MLPPGAKFYPWPHQVTADGSCQWFEGNNIPGQITGFGGEAKAWGRLEFTNYGGGVIKTDNFAGRLMRNTC